MLNIAMTASGNVQVSRGDLMESSCVEDESREAGGWEIVQLSIFAVVSMDSATVHEHEPIVTPALHQLQTCQLHAPAPSKPTSHTYQTLPTVAFARQYHHLVGRELRMCRESCTSLKSVCGAM
jgi:hypothetical protein